MLYSEYVRLQTHSILRYEIFLVNINVYVIYCVICLNYVTVISLTEGKFISNGDVIVNEEV